MGLSEIDSIPETGAVFTIGRSRFADNVASHFFIRKDPVVSISCGDEHSAVICQTGRLFVFGSNDWGQLGLGHKNHVSKPSCVKVLKPEKVTHVACGRAHTLICTGGQKVFACGSDQEGQLGRGSSAVGDSVSSPVLVYDCGLAGPRILRIAAGSHHSLALTSDGGVVAWGSNLEGQLGLPGISGLVNKPTKVHIPEPVKDISAGYYHSAFLTESGLIYVCGESESGKLGIDVNFSTQVAPKQMQLPSPAIQVACGGHHTFVLADNGSLYCAGSNASGQLGMGTNVTEVQTPKLLPRGALQNETISHVACGESHSAVLTESGKLYTCGDGRHGKLGLEENENNVHELTFAPKYQELFVSKVACGGCHTILVGRRRESSNQGEREVESTQMDHAQKKNPLPPLKLPLNRLQNESPEEKTNENDNTELQQNKSNTEMNETKSPDNIRENTIENSQEHNNTNSITNSSKTPEKIESPKKASESREEETPTTMEAPKESSVSDQSKDDRNDNEKSEPKVDTENNVPEKEKTESTAKKNNNEETSSSLDNKDTSQANEENNNANNSENNQTNNKENNNENTIEKTEEKGDTAINEVISNDTEKNETSSETKLSPPGSTPPPKPPRLKPGSGNGSSTERKSSAEGEKKESSTIVLDNEKLGNNIEIQTSGESRGDQESSPGKRSTKSGGSGSTKSRIDTTETIRMEKQNSSEVVDGKEKTVEGKTENETGQDDADVVQSPAPRTRKSSKLFKSKRQEEMENGTKTTGTANHKTKSKTCTVL